MKILSVISLLLFINPTFADSHNSLYDKSAGYEKNLAAMKDLVAIRHLAGMIHRSMAIENRTMAIINLRRDIYHHIKLNLTLHPPTA